MNAALGSLSLIDQSGQFIVLAILGVLVTAILANVWVRMHYRQLESDLVDAVPHQPFSANVLNRIFHDAQSAARARAGELDPQGIVEHRFQTELGGLLVSERYIKAAPGLVIILGLVGTFYGLTLSIGRLAELVSSEGSGVTAMTTALTSGLTQALSGMSVAFTTSLVGIASAIVLTLLGIFFSVTDRRTRLMVHIENFIDSVLAPEFAVGQTGSVIPEPPRGTGFATQQGQVEQLVEGFGRSAERLEASMQQFEASLKAFSGSAREFGQFNAHLRDNIQRMSLTFADFSDGLKAQPPRERGRGPQ